MKRFVLIIFIMIFITGCSNSPASIERAIAKTQTAMPTNTPTPTITPTPTSTPTPTPLPLSQVKLEEIVLIQGDLPIGYSADPIGRDTTNPMLEDVKAYEQMVIQEFSKTNEGIGLVAVFLFDTLDKRDSAYEDVKGKLNSHYDSILKTINPTVDIGDEGIVYYQPIIGKFTISTLIFVRCNAFVYIAKSMDDSNSTVLKSYSKKLDSRLSELLCNKY